MNQLQSNKSFVKVNRAFTLSPIYRSLSDNAKVIYQALRGYSDGNYKPCYPSQARLASDTGKSPRSIIRGVKELTEAKIITVTKTSTGSNLYYFPAERGFEVTNLVEPSAKFGTSQKPATPPASANTGHTLKAVQPAPNHVTNLSPKQELSFKLQQNNKKELVCMSKKTFLDDFAEIKRLSPEGLSEQKFAEGFNQGLEKFIRNYSLDRYDDCVKELGRKGDGYQQKLILLAGILAHGYSQETIEDPPGWAVSEFKKHFTKGAFPKPINPQFFLVASDLIYQQYHEEKQRTEQVNARIKSERMAEEKAVQNRMTTAQNAPSELQQEAERLFPIYSDNLFDVRRAQILREEWICEQLKQKQGVA